MRRRVVRWTDMYYRDIESCFPKRLLEAGRTKNKSFNNILKVIGKNMKINSNWKLGAAVGTALSMGSGAAFAGPHGFDLHNVFHGASAAMAGTSIAHVEDPVSAVFGNPATLTTYYGGTNFMFGATFYMPRARMQHDGSAGYATGEAAALVNITNGATGKALAASGGYLIACAGDEIYANSSSIIGSIGVIYSSFGFTELIKKIGVERRVHTAGKNKSSLDPFQEEKSEDIERLKNIQLDLHKDFIKVVEESRGSKLKKDGIELFSGEFWAGSKSQELGLIDGLGNANEILKEKFGEDVVIKKFEKSKGWLSKRLSSSSNQMDQLANILEERSIWQRYGF